MTTPQQAQAIPPGSCELLELPKSADVFVPLAGFRTRRRRRRPQPTEEGDTPPSDQTGDDETPLHKSKRHVNVRPGDLLAIVLPLDESGKQGSIASESAVGGDSMGQHMMYLCSATASFATARQRGDEDQDDDNYVHPPPTKRTLKFDPSTSAVISANSSLARDLTSGGWRRVCGDVQESNSQVQRQKMCKYVKYVDVPVADGDSDDTIECNNSSLVGIYCASRSIASPLLTLTMRVQRNADGEEDADDTEAFASLPPLTSALAKRLMAGRIVVVNSTTTLRFPPLGLGKVSKDGQELILKAEAVMPDNSGVGGRHASSGPFIVFPSTRITILSSEKGPETAGAISDNATTTASAERPYQSVATKTLVEVIKSVRIFANAAVASGGLSGTTSGFLARSILFSGPPGVGKTYAAKMACTNPQTGDAKLDRVWAKTTKLVSLRGSDLLSQSDTVAGASRELARIFNAAADYAGREPENVAVIFLDECDALLTSNSCATMLAALLDKMDGSPTATTMLDGPQISSFGWLKTIVVAATNRIDAVPAYLRRPGRFDKEIGVSPPDSEERTYILKSLLDSCRGGIDIEIKDKELAEIADLCVGYVAADLSSLVRKATTLALEECAAREMQGGSGQRVLLADHLHRSMADVGASTLRDAAVSKPPTTTWDDIAGDAGGAKTALRQAVEWPRTRREDFARLGLSAPRGILLHGPPGCAKTTLARAAAGSAGVAFLSLAPADVYASSYVGEAEAIVRRAFALAKSSAPCILFFDEVDSILGSDAGDNASHGMGRGGRGSSAEARVLSTLLNEMDGVDGSIQDGVLVLGATNRPDCIDAALLRPGRFDKVIYVPPPDVPARRAILKRQCEKWGMQISDEDGASSEIDVDYLASDSVTGKMTGAEIVGACREAAMIAIRESLERPSSGEGVSETTPKVTQEHLATSLKNVKPLLSNESLELEYNRFQDGAKW